MDSSRLGQEPSRGAEVLSLRGPGQKSIDGCGNEQSLGAASATVRHEFAKRFVAIKASCAACFSDERPGRLLHFLRNGHAPPRLVIAFQVVDMTSARCAGVVTKALKAVDHAALVRVDMATFTVEIEPSSATARQLSDAIKRAGYSPVAA